MTLSQYFDYRQKQGLTTNYRDSFYLYLRDNNRLFPREKSLSMWIDLYNDYKQIAFSVSYPLNVRPNRR